MYVQYGNKLISVQSSTTYVYLLSIIAVRSNFSIDRAVGSPGLRKDVVDGLNDTSKKYLKK